MGLSLKIYKVTNQFSYRENEWDFYFRNLTVALYDTVLWVVAMKSLRCGEWLFEHAYLSV